MTEIPVLILVPESVRVTVCETVLDSLPDLSLVDSLSSPRGIVITDAASFVYPGWMHVPLVDDMTELSARVKEAAADLEHRTTEKPVVVLVGAFDRFNVGDLLLGDSFREQFEAAGFSVVMAGIVPADLRHAGGHTVFGFAELATYLSAWTPIVHVGGETLGVTVPDAAVMLPPVEASAGLSGLYKRHRFGLDDRRYGYVTPETEVIRGRLYQWHRRYFFGVGGAHHTVDSIREPAAVLRGASFVSVRDNATYRVLSQHLPELKLTNDAVAGYCTEPGTPSEEPYLLFHASAQRLSHDMDRLLEQVALAAEHHGLRVICTTTGTAAQHDSVSLLTAFSRRLLRDHNVYSSVQPGTGVTQIQSLIRGASVVVSSSLHLRILAANARVPRVSLSSIKVNAWVQTWDEDMPIADAWTVAGCVTTALSRDSYQVLKQPETFQVSDLVRLVLKQVVADQSARQLCPESPELFRLQDAAILGEEYRIIPASLLRHLTTEPSAYKK